MGENCFHFELHLRDKELFGESPVDGVKSAVARFPMNVHGQQFGDMGFSWEKDRVYFVIGNARDFAQSSRESQDRVVIQEEVIVDQPRFDG